MDCFERFIWTPEKKKKRTNWVDCIEIVSRWFQKECYEKMFFTLFWAAVWSTKKKIQRRHGKPRMRPRVFLRRLGFPVKWALAFWRPGTATYLTLQRPKILSMSKSSRRHPKGTRSTRFGSTFKKNLRASSSLTATIVSVSAFALALSVACCCPPT